MLAPDQREILGSSPSAPKFVSMWDGVTGNASGFELEDEGSTPSPTAKLRKIVKRPSIEGAKVPIHHERTANSIR